MRVRSHRLRDLPRPRKQNIIAQFEGLAGQNNKSTILIKSRAATEQGPIVAILLIERVLRKHLAFVLRFLCLERGC